MSNKTGMFGISLLILTLIVAAILGLVSSPSNPLTWLLIGLLVVLPVIHRRLTSKPYVEWEDEYSVGIESIDRQHRKLINLINNLQTAVDYSVGAEYEREALDALVDYTRAHFSYEEGLMEDNGYPDFTTHLAEHKRMILRVEEVLREYEQNRDAAMQDAADFLRHWLINHIKGTDRSYSSYLIDRGVT